MFDELFDKFFVLNCREFGRVELLGHHAVVERFRDVYFVGGWGSEFRVEGLVVPMSTHYCYLDYIQTIKYFKRRFNYNTFYNTIINNY